VEVVHALGQPADIEPVLTTCRRHGIAVLEDAAESLGATWTISGADGRSTRQHTGTRGRVGAFSFNGNKIVTTTGGGMLAARRKDWVEKARFWSTQARDEGIAYHHTEIGYNYRLSNVLAGIGRGQLEVLDRRVEQRRQVAFRYRDAFADIPALTFMPQAPYGLHTNWLSCFLLDEGRCSVTRDRIIEALAAENIEARPLWKPMHLQPLYARNERYGGEVCADLFRRGRVGRTSHSMRRSHTGSLKSPPATRSRAAPLARAPRRSAWCATTRRERSRCLHP
jgi:pyridoxal phosphate-dependent aminotransferase EpsN